MKWIFLVLLMVASTADAQICHRGHRLGRGSCGTASYAYASPVQKSPVQKDYGYGGYRGRILSRPIVFWRR